MNRFIHACMLSLFVLPVAAIAGEMAEKSIEAAVDAGFTEFERQLIEKYYGKRPQPVEETRERETDSGKDKSGKKGKDKGSNKDMPPGLAKRDQLPPGLAKRDTLPPGLAKRNLPDDLEKQLPPPPKGYTRRVVDDVDQAVVVLIDEATGQVADIVKDIIIPKGRD
ncbi:MAG: hypothetical protein HYY48_00235 [Gammaproteobacteria bacterium]|nr:hypothetical protein [Gammaproteobacteria bacterium]